MLNSGVNGKLFALLLQSLLPPLHHKQMVFWLFHIYQFIQCFLNLNQAGMVSNVEKEKSDHEKKQHMVGFHSKSL